ncbi:9590_t:CDS:1 [Funneliformis geosporum]|uniref:9590_t:CDS:1 n=1 Tax=Funneliformis geosporum TaxID=1117311 RepID=A0A9W4WLX4_9GLOM|nr:9590_t:CDS:1 [Funneliformis geosporum]
MLHPSFQQKNKQIESQSQILQAERLNLEAILESKDDYINNLEKANENLKKNVIKCHSALGDIINATSFHLGSQNSNSAVQFSEDIYALHSNLEKFCRLKRGVEINESEVKVLLEKNGCSISGNMRNSKFKHMISSILERHVIENVIEKTKEYFDKQKNDVGDESQQHRLEEQIVNGTEKLLKLIESISKNRAGDEKVSKATSTKIRQQIYGVLGNRGFSNIIIDKEDKVHPLIVNLRKDITSLMNKYRTIKIQEKLLDNEMLTDQIVRQIVNIFFFGIKVQEPIAEWKFFEKNTKVNNLIMYAAWDEEELENSYVDACSFPIFGFNLCEAEKADKILKVIFQAQIIPGNTLKDK